MDQGRPIGQRDSLVGLVIGNDLEVVRVLGTGGMGNVYLARHRSLDVMRAIKTIRADREVSTHDEARFQREAIALSRLRHEGIVQVFDAGRVGGKRGSLYLVMEYLDGPNLEQLVTQQGRVPLRSALEIVRQIADALEYAHAQGVVHRDLKPGNVLLRRTKPTLVKIIDFGLAKLLESDLMTQLTGDSQIVGTPLYMAPEQGLGGAVGPPADVYAVGGVAYHLITGKPVFSGPTQMAVILAQHQQAPPPLSARLSGVEFPDGLEQLLLQCLAKSPDARPSARAVSRALEQMVAEVSESPDEPAYEAALETIPVGHSPSQVISSLIWGKTSRASDVYNDREAQREALTNQITAVVMELAADLERLPGCDTGPVQAQVAEISAIQEKIEDLDMDAALLGAEVEELALQETQEARDLRARFAELRKQSEHLSRGLFNRYRLLFGQVMELKAQTQDPYLHDKYAELDGLIRAYLSLVSTG